MLEHEFKFEYLCNSSETSPAYSVKSFNLNSLCLKQI